MPPTLSTNGLELGQLTERRWSLRLSCWHVYAPASPRGSNDGDAACGGRFDRLLVAADVGRRCRRLAGAPADRRRRWPDRRRRSDRRRRRTRPRRTRWPQVRCSRAVGPPVRSRARPPGRGRPRPPLPRCRRSVPPSTATLRGVTDGRPNCWSKPSRSDCWYAPNSITAIFSPWPVMCRPDRGLMS